MSVVRTLFVLAGLAGSAVTGATSVAAEAIPPKDRDFFESKIRPLLVKRCFACHSTKGKSIEGGLRLDSRPSWQRGGDSGPAIVPGQPEKSRLMRAVEYVDEDLAMPPDGVLPKSEIALIRQWISRGAPDPRSTATPTEATASIDWKRGRAHWAFQSPQRQTLPDVLDTHWPQNAVDSFVLARLEAHQLRPVPPASSETLVRRITLDLTGLAPSPNDVNTFLSDTRPGSWNRLIERLLASPAYGEKWGRHWLDVVRYADDQLRTEYYYRPLPHAWRYRDWVVRALNEDLPYDQFVIHQLAGDLVPTGSGANGGIAVGLLALGMMYQDDGGTPDGVAIAKAETLDDRVDTVTRGFLALTVACARCHDHKFDPIPTSDYYSLAGIFNNTGYIDELVLVKPEAAAEYNAIQGRITSLNNQLKAAKKDDNKERIASINRSLAITHQEASLKFPRAHSVRDTGSANMRIALRGNLRKPGPIAPRRFLQALAGDSPPPFTSGSGRLELARSIADPRNPLTARVIVNRLWQHHFGRGLVGTASNFGFLGERPTHPRLLDWLAIRLMDSGWSIKQVHREILQSATYRLASTSTPAHIAADPDNRLLWRMARTRLDIESWRDAMLAVSGSLDDTIGGPAVDNLFAASRRTIYAAVHRDIQTESDKLLRLFDFPNPRTGSGGRIATTIPQQQLFALNSPFVIARARELAIRAAVGTASPTDRISQAMRLAVGRSPTPQELALGCNFLGATPDRRLNGHLSFWEQYCQALLGSNEFLFRP